MIFLFLNLLFLLNTAVQAFDPIIVTGAPVPLGSSVPSRLELRELQKLPEQWNLYLLALDYLQFMNQSEDTSWYGLTGIHGRPYKPWNDAQASSEAMANSGYCTHVSGIFLTWHRPYLALYEQILVSTAKQIAAMYPEGPTRDRYITAAATLRIPYWDWAAVMPGNEGAWPDIISGSPSIEVDGPSGTQIIANPLYNYYFVGDVQKDLPEFPLVAWNQTLRFPNSTQTCCAAQAHSQDNQIASIIAAQIPGIRARLYNLLTNPMYAANFSRFGSEAWIPSGSNTTTADSLEALHDLVHGITGVGGHMSYIEYSSFDPVFFLHHANVDRLFSMFQMLNPDTYVQPQASGYTTFNNKAGQIQDVNTPLTPFRNSSTTFWISAGVKDASTFGYTYPETSNAQSTNFASQQAQLRATINDLYGPQSSSAPGKRAGLGSAGCHTFMANIVAYRNGLQKPYFIHLYLANPAIHNTIHSISADPAYLGSHFVNAAIGHISDQRVSASIPLVKLPGSCHPSVSDSWIKGVIGPETGGSQELNVASSDEMLSFVSEKLRYEITYADGSVIEDKEATKGLVEVSVIHVEMSPGGGMDAFPIWGEARGRVAGTVEHAKQ